MNTTTISLLALLFAFPLVAQAADRQMDEARSGGSYVSQNDFRLHFGIGDAAKVDQVEISWPSGRKEYFRDVKANQIVTLEEGNGSEK